jgi:signal transduction histidine kinase
MMSGPFGVRLGDVGFTAVVIGATEINVATGGGVGAAPLNAKAYLLGAALGVPVLFRRRWPFQVLLACSVLLFGYYSVDRRNISPAPLLSLPLFDAAVAGYLAWAIAIPACFMAIGFIVVGLSKHERLVQLMSDLLPSVVVLFLAVALGEVVRSRRALAAETATRLRLAEEERESETGRRVAEERLRIARELHDTVAHSMATITVQAGSALHVLDGRHDRGPAPGNHPVAAQADALRASLTAIRETSKGALNEMRSVLGQLRRGDSESGEAVPRRGGAGYLAGSLDRLAALCDAVTAAGAPVSVTIEGEQVPLPATIDHAAYRILQESLTNVLRHAGQGAAAAVHLHFQPDALSIRVTDNGTAAAPGAEVTNGAARSKGASGAVEGVEARGGNGLCGMRERAAAAGGQLTAEPRPEGGFEVTATLPIPTKGTTPAISATERVSAETPGAGAEAPPGGSGPSGSGVSPGSTVSPRASRAAETPGAGAEAGVR